MEKPILFSAPMINAILNGQKTMTRRVIKIEGIEDVDGVPYVEDQHGDWCEIAKHSPYHVGDTLWVRETFAVNCIGGKDFVFYRADSCPDGDGVKWEPSIFMPRKYSRINLRITSVRAERLQDITPDDCIREGVNWVETGPVFEDITGTFRALWDSINGQRGYGWDTNPWVWVVGLERIEQVTA